MTLELTGHPVTLLDMGANIAPKPDHLFQYGSMASIYMKDCLGLKKPRIGLLNVGEEKGKGTDVLKEAYELFESSELAFVGNVEGGDMRPWPYNTRTRMVNDELLRIDADDVTYPNFHLVRWDIISDGHPEYLNLANGDPVHYSDIGNEAIADVLAHAPEACNP